MKKTLLEIIACAAIGALFAAMFYYLPAIGYSLNR